jgi:hypothetical protein
MYCFTDFSQVILLCSLSCVLWVWYIGFVVLKVIPYSKLCPGPMAFMLKIGSSPVMDFLLTMYGFQLKWVFLICDDLRLGGNFDVCDSLSSRLLLKISFRFGFPCFSHMGFWLSSVSHVVLKLKFIPLTLVVIWLWDILVFCLVVLPCFVVDQFWWFVGIFLFGWTPVVLEFRLSVKYVLGWLAILCFGWWVYVLGFWVCMLTIDLLKFWIKLNVLSVFWFGCWWLINMRCITQLLWL